MRNSSICVDASLVLHLVMDPKDQQVQSLWEQWDDTGRQIIAPALLYYEVTNGIYQYQKHVLISVSAARLALEAALALQVHLHPESDLHLPALKLAQRFELPATYDTHYLALADRLNAEFWTADKRLAKAVQSELPWVNLLS